MGIMLFSKEKAELLAKIEGLEASAATHESFKAEAEGKIAELAVVSASLADVTASLDTEKAAHAEALTKITALESAAASATAELETKIAAEVVTRCAAAGVEPIKHDSSASDDNKTMVRASFNALTPHDRSAFIRGGGKLTD